MSKNTPDQKTEALHQFPLRRRTLMGLVLLTLIISGSWWGYGKYRLSLLSGFRSDCDRAMSEQDWTSLAAVAGTWAKWEPAEADAWLYLGEACSQLSDHAAAVDALSHIPDESEKAHPALLIASDLQFGPLNQPLNAVATLNRLLKINPRSTTARQRLIYFYAVTLQRQEMLNAIRDALEYQSEPPESYVYLVIADHLSFSNGVAETDKWMKSAPDAEVFQVARVLQLVDRIENADSPAPENLRKSAFAELDKLTKLYPENLALYRYQMEAAARDQDLAKMEQLMQSEPLEAETDSVICRHKGWYYLRTGEIEKAEHAVRTSLELFPLDWHAWNELSSVFRRLGKLDEAEATAKIALEGKELRKELVQLPNARRLSASQLQRIGKYAESAGDDTVSDLVSFRLDVLGQRPPGDEG